ncbi:GNAT family N-acetyltransferase [Mytilinidion resinicola]|uniref:GNAT family N-acetyltransferase n=1 Tax=Mytilinidion resinicola TaxID=574789 RepID=A0A6A6Z6U2_9PEZI|nr:GNAT family N-acetyltransferase [Mytilinidion resinicola]KAF2816822.1 GNAT family N-acetyltransferase [Mytilinidion resinicola]
MAPQVALRAAREGDIPQINAIHAFYVLNTVTTFTITPATDDDALSKFRAAVSQGLPYLVAVDNATADVVGFAYASGFRSGLSGYRHTVEISLFCHPDHRSKGAGTLLLRKLIDVLKHPEDHAEFVTVARNEDARVRNLIACMAVDEQGWKNGLGLKEYYEKFGFEQMGHLKRVGHKFDRWIDTIYLQLCLW